MIKIMFMSTYNDMVLYQVEILKENAELRKVCQCRECKYRISLGEYDEKYKETCVCGKIASDNYGERMNQYGSCKECERR